MPWKQNPRKISEKQLSDLRKSLERFNLMSIPVIDLDNRIVSGHQRIKILQMLGRGEEMIDVRLPNRKLTEKEYQEANLRENANIAEWDFDKLRSFDLGTLSAIGFEDDLLAELWAETLEANDDDFNVEKELTKIKKPETRLGDLIIMGQHRLIVGDSTDPAVLKKLFGKEKASMIYSDPIYNIKIDYNAGIGGKRNYGGNVNDSRTDEEYKEFLKKSLVAGLSVTKDDAHIFYWSDETYIWLMQTLYREFGISNKRVCLWLKNGQNPTPGVAFNKCYEPCTYGVQGKPYVSKNLQNLNEVMNKETTTGNNLLEEVLGIWSVKRLSGKDYEHATSKPPKHRHKKFSDKIEVITRTEESEEKLTPEQEKFVKKALELGGITKLRETDHD
jgi:hypothetical protein